MLRVINRERFCGSKLSQSRPDSPRGGVSQTGNLAVRMTMPVDEIDSTSVTLSRYLAGFDPQPYDSACAGY
jgi:hypothetical protein